MKNHSSGTGIDCFRYGLPMYNHPHASDITVQLNTGYRG